MSLRDSSGPGISRHDLEGRGAEGKGRAILLVGLV